MTDIFHEVEEDLRKETVSKIWKRYGPIAIGAFALAIAVAAVVVGIDAYRSSVARAQSEKFQALMEDLERRGAPPAERAKALEGLAGELSGGYAFIARMEAAGALVGAGEWSKAAEAYDAVAADTGLSSGLRDLARLKAALLEAEGAGLAEMEARLAGLSAPQSPLRFSAAELLAFTAYKAGDDVAAKRYLDIVMGDPAAPPDLRDRVSDLVALVEARSDIQKPAAPTAPENAAPDQAGPRSPETSTDR